MEEAETKHSNKLYVCNAKPRSCGVSLHYYVAPFSSIITWLRLVLFAKF
jgi:hypothetical protein